MSTACAIDCGSNSLILTIADLSSTPVQPNLEIIRIVGLSRGLKETGSIRADRLAEALKVCAEFADIIKKNDCPIVRATGTEVFRRAKNGKEVLRKMEDALQAPIELISGEREAELSFLSVQSEYPDPLALKTVFDIGGASTELCIGNQQGIIKRISLKLGCVTLTEEFKLDQAQNPSAALNTVLQILKESFDSNSVKSIGIGVAGTVTSLLATHLKLANFSRNAVHLKPLTDSNVKNWLTHLSGMNLEERRSLIGLHPQRADVIVAGTVIIQALMKFFSWKQIICMDSGVRYGVLYEIQKAKDCRRFPVS